MNLSARCEKRSKPAGAEFQEFRMLLKRHSIPEPESYHTAQLVSGVRAGDVARREQLCSSEGEVRTAKVRTFHSVLCT